MGRNILKGVGAETLRPVAETGMLRALTPLRSQSSSRTELQSS